MIIRAIKKHFDNKQNNKTTASAPEGVCISCWGRSEWDGKYYDIVKNKKSLPGSEIYESFISKIVEKHTKTTKKEGNKYICTSCNKEI